ncbi:MAG: enoyl-CoA hydratase/isomerase family protein [Acidobacteria bacterium]|nr:MAG: enoyl-CoA hydratase/isomerase family protein [Acidobacteriota bacterium]GIK77505.1 MAG: enoyl-CoA hydratase [Actinomycetes bacterium]
MSAGERLPVRLERDGDVAVIVLDDPPLNLFTERTFVAMREARDAVAGSDARAMVFRAEGDVFTGGVDVGKVFRDVPGGAEGRRLAADGIRELQAFESLEIPTLALVHGLCLTAGLEAALGCDMIWAAEGARFGLVERVVGLTPFGGGVQRMAERAGSARAREFVMTGGLYDAAKLLDWGVVNRVVPPEHLLEKGMGFARELAAGPTLAHGATKRLVRAYLEGGVAAADAAVADVAGPLFDSEDLRGAVRSFLEDGPGKATFRGE